MRDILGDVPVRSKRLGLRFLKSTFLDQQEKAGKIRRDLDVDMRIFALLQIQEGFLDDLAVKRGVVFAENARKGKPLFPPTEDIVRKELEGFAEIWRTGLAPRVAGRHGGRT